MILIDNINYLRENFPKAREILKKVEEREEKDFFIEETRKGDKTIFYNKCDKKIYFHSKYNPIREAEAIIDEYKDIKDSNIIFYGTGLGYHIDLFIKNNPNNNFYIFEPIPEVMEKFLSVINLKKKEYKNLKGMSIGLDNIEVEIDRFLDLNRKETIIIALPIHRKTFEKEFKEFSDIFLKIVKAKRQGIAVNYGFQRRWIINSMKNFKEVLNTPNILLEKKGQFEDKPAILVAAGPSLNEEIENIRHIKEKGLAYIFSVGSAINTLIYHDIYPDAATTYDPTERNQIVFEKIVEKNIKDIPLIFGSSVGYETLEKYPGEKYHMITSQDSVANYYLKTEEKTNINIVEDASSIAVVTLQLLCKLNFNPIILVGQNLAYKGKKLRSEGLSYDRDISRDEIDTAIVVSDVEGNEVLTSKEYKSMREQIEYYIKKNPSKKVINTTKGGAKINGANFEKLEAIISNNLNTKVVEDNWLGKKNTNYDKNYLEIKIKKMERFYYQALKINNEYKIILNKIERQINNKNFLQAEKLYVNLDKQLKKIENNDFYKTFILPINRVEYKIFASSIDNLNEIKDPNEKGNEIVKEFRKFIDVCIDNIDSIKPIYESLKEEILKYIEH